MLKRVLITSALVIGTANAGMFGGLGSVVSGSASTAAAVSANDVSGVISMFQSAEKSLNDSAKVIIMAIGDKNTIEYIENEQKEINKMTEGAEKDARTKKLNESTLATADKASSSKDAAEKAKKLSSEQKKKVSAATFNVFLAAFKDKVALEKSKNLVSAISSNPSAAMQFAGDLPKLKDIVTSVPNQLTTLGSLGSGLTTLAKNADISLPTTPIDANTKQMGLE